MILDSLENIAQYRKLHPGFAEAFEFIRSTRLAALASGRHDIRGNAAYVSVGRGPGRAREEGMLEIHRRYIDIQIVLEGVDEMGWKPLSGCSAPETGYEEERDIQFFRDAPDTWFAVKPGQFVIFFPEDAHLPIVSAGNVHKAVVKVEV